MKKILLPLFIIALSACTLGMSTPKQVVSSFLDKYKNEDSNILSQLDETINTQFTNEDYKKRYRTLMTNQYKNMEYKIKDESIEDDNAIVEAEITVYDYASAIRNANDYLNSNPNEFTIDSPTIDMDDANDETTKDTEDDKAKKDEDKKLDSSNYDQDKFTNYRLTQMENVNDTVTYTIQFTLTKVDGKWQMDQLSNTDIEKLHGIYVE